MVQDKTPSHHPLWGLPSPQSNSSLHKEKSLCCFGENTNAVSEQDKERWQGLNPQPARVPQQLLHPATRCSSVNYSQMPTRNLTRITTFPEQIYSVGHGSENLSFRPQQLCLTLIKANSPVLGSFGPSSRVSWQEGLTPAADVLKSYRNTGWRKLIFLTLIAVVLTRSWNRARISGMQSDSR